MRPSVAAGRPDSAQLADLKLPCVASMRRFVVAAPPAAPLLLPLPLPLPLLAAPPLVCFLVERRGPHLPEGVADTPLQYVCKGLVPRIGRLLRLSPRRSGRCAGRD